VLILPASKRIIVTLSEILLSEVDYFTTMENRNRSDIVREAIQYYLDKRKREVLVEQMKNGYLEMALINLTFACEIFDLEENQECYEFKLVEWHHI
jgi:CopG family transcriptional regulator/antitoxin EndoAI